MAEVHLSLFGRFQAHFPSGRAVELASRKARALLAYLALHAGQAQSREKLIALLWSNRAERQGRDSLRQALTALRKGLGSEGVALLMVDGDAIAAEPSAVEVDTLTFEQLLTGGTPEDLERAVELYRGDFLDGIGVRDPAFEDWMYAERERLHGRAVEALAKVLAYQVDSGAADRAMATAARLLQLDPLQESAHRVLMRLHAERGQRGLALRQYQVCAAVLKRELGIAPNPETVALYDTIRQARELLIGSKIEVARSAEEEHADELARAPPPIDALSERRHLTIMFINLVGSMELSTQLDPEQMRDLLVEYQKAVAQEVARFEGQVTNVIGDAVLVYFGWPHAHEDDVERAIWAALAVRASVDALRSPKDHPLTVRIGIASGLVVIGQGMGQDTAVVGETPNLASRLRALASPGQIIIAESTRRLLSDMFELADLGTKSVRGIREPVRAFAIIGERPVESRFDARSGPSPLPMVGRDQELALLLERWALAKAGEGQGVLLVGEAGIGKSRIGRALLDAVADEPHTCMRYQCSPYHSDSTLWPVVQQLKRAAGLVAGEPLEAGLDKVEGLLGQADRIESAPLIASLIGLYGAARYGEMNLTPQAQRAYTLRALVKQMLGLAARQPVLVVFEDVHWIDPTTLELIEQCLDQIAAARVLILLTSRPDQQPALAAHPHVTRLTLNRLGRGGVEAIVMRLGGDHLPVETVDTIIARTDGVPLFVEELTKAVLETGETAIPASLHDSLMARLDRIPEVKEVAQIAACIGREFDYSLLAAVVDRAEPTLQAALDRLAAAELVFRRGMPPTASYAFKHTLVQDAAYSTLLKSRRQQLHARITKVLEEQFPTTAEARPELLAHHCTEAGLIETAVQYWHKAGQQAIASSAMAEAIAQLTKGFGLLARLPDGAGRRRRELGLQLLLGGALSAGRGTGLPETGRAYARAAELCEQTGETSLLAPALHGLIVFHFSRAELAPALALAEQALAAAERQDRIAARAAGHFSVGWVNLALGSLGAARGHLERALKLHGVPQQGFSRLTYHWNVRVKSLAYLSWALLILGHPERARARSRDALSEAKRPSHPFMLGFALHRALTVLQLYRDVPAVAETATAMLDLGRQQGFPIYVAAGTFNRGWLLVQDGAGNEGVALMHQTLSMLRANGDEDFLPYSLALLAEAHGTVGQTAAALGLLDEALARVERTDERLFEAELHRLKGELLLASSGADQAKACLRRAIEVARAQDAKLWELRAALSLARLWAEYGERGKAHDLLAPVYGWFTEGFETADLKDAKALLAALG